MKKIILVMLVLLSQTHMGKAQEHFIPGSILTLSNDTMRGLIDYRDWELNPSRINFKNSSGEITTYTPDGILAFRVSNDVVFLSKHLAMDVSNYRVQDLGGNNPVQIVSDTAVFVRLIVRGQLNLYYLKDAKDKDHFWFQNNKDSIYEMRITRKIVSTQGMAHQTGLAVATLKIYQIILPGIVAGCPSVSEKAKTVDFSMPAFTKIATRYNECINGDKGTFVAKQKKIKVTYGLIAGASLLSLKFFGANDVVLTHVTFPKTWTYTGGAALKIILPYLQGSWIIYNDLVYRPYHVSTTYDTIYLLYPSKPAHYTFDISMGYLKLNTMLRYQFPKWVVKPFINVGMSNSFALVNKNSYTMSINLQTPIYKEGPAIESVKSYEAGFICGIGACFKGLGLEFRYEWANGMSAYAGFTGSENSFTFLLSYTFGQK